MHQLVYMCMQVVGQELVMPSLTPRPLHLRLAPRSDKRSAVSLYCSRFPGIDFSLISPDEDAQWTVEHRETKDEVRARGLAFLRWVMARPEQHIAVVTHSSFLHFTLSCFGHSAGMHIQDDMHKARGVGWGGVGWGWGARRGVCMRIGSGERTRACACV